MFKVGRQEMKNLQKKLKLYGHISMALDEMVEERNDMLPEIMQIKSFMRTGAVHARLAMNVDFESLKLDVKHFLLVYNEFTNHGERRVIVQHDGQQVLKTMPCIGLTEATKKFGRMHVFFDWLQRDSLVWFKLGWRSHCTVYTTTNSRRH